ncbi:conserved hypothetical protein [Gluconacetobacter diazotrophicus PA1 5]|nr:hypothetical protein [Gluconacetobacter diazotrophicus]ACI51958.1 conserved hypothetical protein [Gluconacetobacter diazotrophicus PA1 5]MBB2157129.1 hypothetical protein [Gluconacetobacter diazotrophicus]TWB05137.1 hypothetical protein FBZ86_11826 [Gluconacetobacter diazotrophicus]
MQANLQPVPAAAMDLVARHGDDALVIARRYRDDAQDDDDEVLVAYWNAILETSQYLLEESPDRHS